MMSMIAAAILLIAIPLFFKVLKSRSHRKYGYMLVGLLPFVSGWANLDAAIIDWAGWPGYAKGAVITVVDSLAVAILLSHRIRWRGLPLRWPLLAYLFTVCISVMFSASAQSSLFYVFQIIRMLALFVAVSAVVQDRSGLHWIAIGLSIGAIVQALVAIDQRFSGTFQAAGTLGHQNLLGMMLHFVTLPLLAMLLAGAKNRILFAGVAAALLAVALGASRGTTAFVIMGIGLLFILSLFRRPTALKWKTIGGACLVLILVAPLMISGIEKRLEGEAAESSDLARETFEDAANLMWAANPFGVGANQYVVVANSQGYSEAAGVTWGGGSLSAHVHNAYLLAAAETGWLGLFALISLFASPIILGLRFSFTRPKDPVGDVVLGVTVAMIVLAVHNFYEWIFFLFPFQYIFAIGLGIISGLVQARRSGSKVRRLPGTSPH
ncbi:O-antigen ligase family protein [Altererythrobacter sp. SALINAS58]|uniref:O-antigen ligase family protein n=1 Tax=Alteripontixanthobacter muriae TaxID=2705546 RepID=UPI00157679F0|nr:O-antigen ligase family protein [Alteripontixanthobacter muriae]NTZ43961.1 O-antigen ligase family protein [Alteripontixanthobacter muriae]